MHVNRKQDQPRHVKILTIVDFVRIIQEVHPLIHLPIIIEVAETTLTEAVEADFLRQAVAEAEVVAADRLQAADQVGAVRAEVVPVVRDVSFPSVSVSTQMTQIIMIYADFKNKQIKSAFIYLICVICVLKNRLCPDYQ